VTESASREHDREVTVSELMRPPVTTVERHAHLAAAAYQMKRAGADALVVISDENDRQAPIAIITDADIAQAVADGKDLDEVRISDLVSREPVTVPPTTSVSEAATLMVSSKIRHLPVVEDGRLLGMLDVSDACRGLLDSRDHTAIRTG
jgi:CBS domain-containing protein